MNKKRILTTVIVDRLASKFPGQRREFIEFFLQLLAWRKISEKGEIESGLQFPKSLEEKLSIFKIYATFSELSVDYEAFQIRESTLESLSGDQSAALIECAYEFEFSDITQKLIARLITPRSSRMTDEYLMPT